jgi:hypothetical protein
VKIVKFSTHKRHSSELKNIMSFAPLTSVSVTIIVTEPLFFINLGWKTCLIELTAHVSLETSLLKVSDFSPVYSNNFPH